MNRRAGLLFLLACALSAPVRIPDARADEPQIPPALQGEALRTHVKQWIEDLRSDSFATRQTARHGLQRYGTKARDLLEAVADDEDPEVRRTVRLLLGGEPTKTAPVAPGDLAAIGRVTLPASDATLKDLGRQFGGRFEMPDDWTPPESGGEIENEPYFEALRMLLKRADLSMKGPFDGAGHARLVHRDAEAVVVPQAAAGPVLVRVTEVTSTRALTSTAKPHYSLTLDVWWVPSVAVSQLSTPTVTAAEDTAGNAFRATTKGRVTYGVSPMQSSRSVNVTFQPTTDVFHEKLAKLVVKFPMRIRHVAHTVRFDDIEKLPRCRTKDGKDVEPGTEGSVELRSFEPVENQTGSWVVELVAVLPKQLARTTAQIFVRWAGGREQRLHVMGGRSHSADGTLNLTGRAYGAGIGKPEAIWVTWFDRESDGELEVVLKDVPLR